MRHMTKVKVDLLEGLEDPEEVHLDEMGDALWVTGPRHMGNEVYEVMKRTHPEMELEETRPPAGPVSFSPRLIWIYLQTG